MCLLMRFLVVSQIQVLDSPDNSQRNIGSLPSPKLHLYLLYEKLYLGVYKNISALYWLRPMVPLTQWQVVDGYV